MYTAALSFIIFGLFGVVYMDGCPKGFDPQPFKGKCYAFVKTKKTHCDATINCRKLGGYLAEPLTKEENDYISSKIEGRAFIGFTDKRKENVFIGAYSKTPAVYKNWRSGEPNNFGSGEDCVEINYPKSKNALWNDIFCKSELLSVCEYTPPKPKVTSCPQPWTLHGNHCYKVQTGTADWCTAQIECKKLGGYLAEPKNKAENTIVSNLISARQWIGLNDIVRESVFEWYSDSTPWNPHPSLWYAPSHEPNNYGTGEHCVETNYKTHGKWNDLFCDRKLRYICQLK